MRIAHISDIHFGRIEIPEIVGALVDELNEVAPDLVVVSGDLTQRARRWQYEAARAMLGALDAPTLVVPGNHDVHAWWRPHARILRPLERFNHYITRDLTPTFEADGVTVLGINSAHGRTIMGGRIGSKQRSVIGEYFSSVEDDPFKVLVVHHHLVRIQALGPHDVARKAREALRTAAAAGVDLILCGHLHISHIELMEIEPLGHRIVIATAGTATSSRGRKHHRRTNFYNLIDVSAADFTIEERRYSSGVHRFLTEHVSRFERTKVGHARAG